MFVSILLIGLSGVIGIYIFYKRQYEYWSTQNIRVTIPKFPLGDIYETGFSKNIGIVLKEIYDKFGGERYNGMWFFYRPYIMIRDPDLIKLMLVRDFNNFKHRGLYFNEKIDPLSGKSFIFFTFTF